MNKAKYGTEVVPQQPYPVPASPPSIPIDEHVEVFNSSRPSQNNSSLDQSSLEDSSQDPTSTNQTQKTGEGNNVQEPMSVSDIIVQNAPENYGKRLYPLFLPAQDARERWEQLKAVPLQDPSFSLVHIQTSADILASFFDNEGRGILKPAEKRVLEHIRSALMHLSCDFDYER